MKIKITTGKKRRPQRVTIYTPEGFGKSTFGASYPAPLFLDTEEGGTDHLDVPRVRVAEYKDAVEAIAFLNNEKHEFKTVVVDTVDWLEKRIAESLCKEHKQDSIEGFGYGKGYVYLAEEFGRFLLSLDELIAKGMNVLVLAHSHVKSFTPPDAATGYDRFELKLSKQCGPLLKEWSDALLFGNFFTRIQERESGKARGVGGNERVLYAEHSAAWDAKNRVGLEGRVDFTHKAISDLIIDEAVEQPADAPQVAEDCADGFTVDEAKRALNERIVARKMDGGKVLAFLVGRGVMKEGGKFDDIPADYAERIGKNPDRFLDTVEASVAEEGAE